jgi:tetratricopeptide (TPR) repeat protein
MTRGYIVGRLGRIPEAEQLARESIRLGVGPLQTGVIYLGLGKRTKALELFEMAIETDRMALAHALPQYCRRELEGDPRFEALAETRYDIPIGPPYTI